MNKKLLGYGTLLIVLIIMAWFAVTNFSGEQGAGRVDQALGGKSTAPTTKPYSAVTREKKLQDANDEESEVENTSAQ